MFATGLPMTTTCDPTSVVGLSRMGFIAGSAGMPQACACSAWARPISKPRGVTAELSDMFCDLKGATARPS